MNNITNIRYIIIASLLVFTYSFSIACDTSVTGSGSNLIDNNDGTFTVDIEFTSGDDPSSSSVPTITYSGGQILNFTPNMLPGNNGNPATGVIMGGNQIVFTAGGTWSINPSFNNMLTLTIDPDDGDPSNEYIGVSNIGCQVFGGDYPQLITIPEVFVAPVPTMSQWGIIALFLILSIIGVGYMKIWNSKKSPIIS